MSTTPTLLACPFCGAIPGLESGPGIYRQHHRVICGTADCPCRPSASRSWPTAQAAADNWNNRAALTQGAGEAVEPVAWASPKQLENLTDPQYDDHGRYLPVRKTSAGLFTAPLYAAPPAQQLQQAVARAIEECAVICERAVDSIWEYHEENHKRTGRNVCTNLAAAIRSKGTHD